MKISKYIKVLSLVLACLLCLMSLTACAFGGKLSVVGTVGEYEVLYEEIYFLANSYKSGLENKYGEYESLDDENKADFDKELKELVYTNIVEQYAILTLCKEVGLTLESEGLDERVDEYIGLVIESEFDGSKSDYEDSMEMYGLTDHYVRFTAAVDFLYSDLLAIMLEESGEKLDDEAFKEIVKTEFARTWHIMIFNDDGESVEANRVKADEALAKLKDGSTSMYKLIGSSYNEDLSITNLDGLYFARGTREEVYENAAFALEVGGVSDVVEMLCENPQGELVSAFCILQRLEIEDAYVDQNLLSLREEYVNSQISVMKEEIEKELKFVPNDYGSSLELSSLENAGIFSTSFIILTVVSLVIVVVAIIFIVKHIKKKKASKGKKIEKHKRIARGE